MCFWAVSATFQKSGAAACASSSVSFLRCEATSKRHLELQGAFFERVSFLKKVFTHGRNVANRRIGGRGGSRAISAEQLSIIGAPMPKDYRPLMAIDN
jgi:hypothetical protein